MSALLVLIIVVSFLQFWFTVGSYSLTVQPQNHLPRFRRGTNSFYFPTVSWECAGIVRIGNMQWHHGVGYTVRRTTNARNLEVFSWRGSCCTSHSVTKDVDDAEPRRAVAFVTWPSGPLTLTWQVIRRAYFWFLLVSGCETCEWYCVLSSCDGECFTFSLLPSLVEFALVWVSGLVERCNRV